MTLRTSTGIDRSPPAHGRRPAVSLGGSRGSESARLHRFAEECLADFPWRLLLSDWTGRSQVLGKGEPHWTGDALEIHVRTASAARRILGLDGLGFLEKFLAGEVDLRGNLYALTRLKYHVRADTAQVLRALLHLVRHRAFQNVSRARVSVKSHYDIPQEVLEVYLDRAYMSYSCAMFEDPGRLDREELLRVGAGASDAFDSLEKAQWRKFKDAVDYCAPAPGDTLLDVGCGYGGQLVVALEHHDFARIVGWTHSSNQAREGEGLLSLFDPARWELNEGDYREDDRVFDHVMSTGMISHVGPRGLVPYVRNVRRRIRKGGRYVHHALMTAHSRLPHGFDVGHIFNKKYVWPGFHWFTVGTHVKALEENGFQVRRAVDLSMHYAKTTAAWYERFMAHGELASRALGEPTFRAWQVFMAGVHGGFLNRTTHVYRLYCEAV